MVFSNYKLKFLIRILILSFSIFLLTYTSFVLQNFIRSFFALALCATSILEMLNFINRVNKDFESFLNALIYEDFTNYYSKSRGNNSKVYKLFNKLNSKYRKIAFEKEVQHAFLQTIIRHINIGILVLDEQDKIFLVNHYLQSLLDISKIKSIGDIENKSSKLRKELEEFNTENSRIVELVINGELYRLTMNSSLFKLDGKSYKLYSFQDINLELDEQEITSWQKLIRVLTHEIMNSVTPISSLTSSLNNLLKKAITQNNVDTKHLEYLSNGLNAVEERSEGLIKFTEAYKKLTQIKYPEFERVHVENIFERVILLHKEEIENLNIQVTISVDSELSLLADKSMLEQVLINLVKNAIQELKGIKGSRIDLKCFQDNKRIHIQVTDNGNGIADDKIDKIFIPFFTTKNKGSGIGLSFARQVMRLHKGIINVNSNTDNTTFTLRF